MILNVEITEKPNHFITELAAEWNFKLQSS